MDKKLAFSILCNSKIPFVVGQASPMGADCIGLIELYISMWGGERITNLLDVPRGILHPRTFKKWIDKLGFYESQDGEYVFFTDGAIGHCGITDGVVVVHQDSNDSRTNLACFDGTRMTRYEHNPEIEQPTLKEVKK